MIPGKIRKRAAGWIVKISIIPNSIQVKEALMKSTCADFISAFSNAIVRDRIRNGQEDACLPVRFSGGRFQRPRAVSPAGAAEPEIAKALREKTGVLSKNVSLWRTNLPITNIF